MSLQYKAQQTEQAPKIKWYLGCFYRRSKGVLSVDEWWTNKKVVIFQNNNAIVGKDR